MEREKQSEEGGTEKKGRMEGREERGMEKLVAPYHVGDRLMCLVCSDFLLWFRPSHPSPSSCPVPCFSSSFSCWSLSASEEAFFSWCMRGQVHM